MPAGEWSGEKNQREGAAAGDKAVPNKGVERVALHQLQEKDHAQKAEEGRGEDADGKRESFAGRDAGFQEVAYLQDGGARHDGERDEEREAGGRFPVETEQQGRRHGDAGARDPGHQGKALGQPDQNGKLQAHLVDAPPFGPGGVGEGEQQPEQDEKERYQGRALAEDLLDGALQGLTHQGSRHRRRDDVEGKPLGGRIDAAPEGAEEIADQFEYVAPEVERQRQEGPDMERDIEGEPGFRPFQKLGDQYQVGGTADGKDFGEALNGTKNCGVPWIHAVLLSGTKKYAHDKRSSPINQGRKGHRFMRMEQLHNFLL